jgi:hypothetical protein
MKGETMSPNGLNLPEFDHFEMAPTLALDKIWKILWMMDPPLIEKFGPHVVIKVKDIYIRHQVQRLELIAQIYQAEAKALREIEEITKLR